MTLNCKRRRDFKRTKHARVWLDGVDVTSRCYYADGRRGVVRLYKLDEQGRKYLRDNDRIATEERRGHVRWGRTA